ncbi:MAG: glycoside hydrolase family 3 C-terminal domain-containing protein [Anaerolineae bacterium]|jgi:beta-glucosidase
MTSSLETHQDTTLSVEARVNDLVSRMTLQEKISQMVHDAPAIERLGVPAYNWWNECLHGVGRAGVATVYPQAIGLAATWNPDLIHQIATAISDEARAKHHYAVRRDVREIYTGLTFWSPNINIFRDPRWGRGQETYGEDPYLTSVMGVSFVRGLQGDDPHHLKLVATPKHYAVHSGPESNRHHFDAQIGEQDLWETYLPAFEACVKQAQAASVMGAYNRFNGEPCCASPRLLEQILRQEWGFDGYVVSDCGAILDIYAHHQVVDTPEEAAALAVKHGCELNCGQVYPALREAVKKGLISEDLIDRAVERLFNARFRLGMFDPPEQVPYSQIPYEVVNCPGHQALARQAAQESIVLLKNQDNLLPLRKNLTAIAIIGPNADDPRAMLGNYNGTPANPVTPLEGIRKKISPATRLYYAPGCEIAPGVPRMDVIPSACLRPKDASVGESGLTAAYYDNAQFEGQPALERIDRLVDFTWKDTTPLTGQWADRFAVRWTGFLVPPVSGTYTLGVNGFSAYNLYLEGELVVRYGDIHHPGLKTHQVELEAGRLYSIRLDLTSRGLDPQTQLLWSLPGADYQARALEVAAKADIIIAVMGLSPALEGEEMPVKIEGFVGGDRTDIRLPRPQRELLQQVHALGKPVVLVLLNGSALAVNWANAHVPAILDVWYPGQAGGEALADVLFGDYNPAGRLPVTFYKAVDDLPPFEDYQMEGRTYRYFQGEVLFPFGYGLSYTTFEFENLRLDQNQAEKTTVSVDVTNTGDRAGDEVVQLYTRRPDDPDFRPIKELKGFKRITLRPGERKTVTFALAQTGTVEVLVGSSSEHLPLKGVFQINQVF